jgi:hypothetical protein
VAFRTLSRDSRACTFIAAADRDKSAADWVMKFNGCGYGIYFAVNPLKRPMTKKAGKEDVASAQWLWVDLDPRKGAELIPERQEMLALLTDRLPEGLPEPTWIIDSGRGYWAFWKLLTPQPVDGDGPRTENVENFGRGIEKAFPGRGDHCRNIERIARLPGTINGKTGKRARVVEHRPKNVYELAAFPRVETSAGEGTAANSHPKNRVNGEPSRYRPDGVDVDRLPVPETIKVMIRTGKHPSDPDRYETRSEAVLAVLVAMVGEGCDDATMAGVMLDPGLPIGAHIREKPDPNKYLERQIRKARHHVANLPHRLPSGLPDKQIPLAIQRKDYHSKPGPPRRASTSATCTIPLSLVFWSNLPWKRTTASRPIRWGAPGTGFLGKDFPSGSCLLDSLGHKPRNVERSSIDRSGPPHNARAGPRSAPPN